MADSVPIQQVLVLYACSMFVLFVGGFCLWYRTHSHHMARYATLLEKKDAIINFLGASRDNLNKSYEALREERNQLQRQLKILIEDRMASELEQGLGVMRPLPACDCEPDPPGCRRIYGARLANGRIRIYDSSDEKATCYADIRIKNLLLSAPVTE